MITRFLLHVLSILLSFFSNSPHTWIPAHNHVSCRNLLIWPDGTHVQSFRSPRTRYCLWLPTVRQVTGMWRCTGPPRKRSGRLSGLPLLLRWANHTGLTGCRPLRGLVCLPATGAGRDRIVCNWPAYQMIHNPDNRFCDSGWECKEVMFKRSDFAVLSSIQIMGFQDIMD